MRLHTGQLLTAAIVSHAPNETLQPVELPLFIVYEDEDIIVLNKPARPAFSTGHFGPLIPLRVESGCHLGNLIFNDLEALQVESSAYFEHLQHP